MRWRKTVHQVSGVTAVRFHLQTHRTTRTFLVVDSSLRAFFQVMVLPATMIVRFFKPFEENIVSPLFSISKKKKKKKASLLFSSFGSLISTTIFSHYHATVDSCDRCRKAVPKRFLEHISISIPSIQWSNGSFETASLPAPLSSSSRPRTVERVSPPLLPARIAQSLAMPIFSRRSSRCEKRSRSAAHRPTRHSSIRIYGGRFIVVYAHIRGRRSVAAAQRQQRRQQQQQQQQHCAPHTGSCIKTRAALRIMIHCAGHESYKL